MPAPLGIPDDIAKDFNEACAVVGVSPKAAAALARRCLQNVLSKNGYESRNLYDQINDFCGDKNPDRIAPLVVRQQVHAIRRFGNFAAHPVNDQTTLQIIEI
jgi:hypothetical protein